MSRRANLIPEFVEFMPKELREGVLYVSMVYSTATHRCCCGCGEKVVTPLSPTDWKLTFDGETVSLSPSVGSWSLPCQSHYWIERNRVEWAPQWSKEEIATGRARERADKDRYYGVDKTNRTAAPTAPALGKPEKKSRLARFLRWLSGGA